MAGTSLMMGWMRPSGGSPRATPISLKETGKALAMEHCVCMYELFHFNTSIYKLGTPLLRVISQR